ncbi:phosphatidylserine/phosphatidylglycerophosphate/cardiolipin synthase family protein [Variovorax sp. YR216]|uniref:phospholipase D-like domain-containing protein n=1 Tax=Variovorax sp. YR216 TaxID=1882828 RepID=UPI0008970DB3|nr:phospholipase D family protein [Variovorax sp. YR216]SEB20872.1 putative cardiolipin synthase [Variovorax sp. YR216]
MALRFSSWWMVLLVLALSACGSLPTGVQRPPSRSLQASPDDSPLARTAAAQLPPGAQSGFRLLPLGGYALEARLTLIRKATRTLDVQYYIMENDASGRAVFRALEEAAGRGVRVRLLLDDINSTGAEPLIEALSGVPNLEIRLFNPFCCARSSLAGRVVTSLGDLPRLDHRMHNKLLIADGALAIVGGRNIADDYFTRSAIANFVDLDAVAAGRVVPQLGVIFDRYWNSEESFPASYFSPPVSPASREATLRQLLPADATQIAIDLPEKDILDQVPVGKELDNGRLTLVPGLAYAVADQPSKRLEDREEIENSSLMTGAVSQMLGARNELVVASPYLVPGKRGIAVLRSLQQKGVQVTLVTNSLPASDSTLVYFGYARYRPAILKAGVDLYELSAVAPRENKTIFGGSSKGRLHAKLVVIDKEVVLLGSLNLDPRSARKNTEVGVAVESPALAEQALRIVEAMKSEAYRVRPAPDGAAGTLAWVSPDADDDDPVQGGEPGISPLNTLQRLLLQPLVPEDYL